MKIVIFGLTISSSWGNGHATLWRALTRALVGRGHEPIFFERDTPYYSHHRDLETIPGGKLIFYSDWEAIRWLARRELREADVGIVTSYCPDGITAGELVCNSGVKRRVFYDLDTPVTLEAIRQGRALNYIGPRGLKDYDLVLSYTGGEALKQLQSRLGARLVAPLYGSVDPEIHRPGLRQERFRSDLSYIGTYAEDRQAALENFFIEPARQLPEQRFLLAGAQYPQQFPWTKNIFFVHHLPPSEHPDFYSSSRLTLNITRRAMAEMGYCPSGRLFEAAACGAPIVSDWWEGLDQFFKPKDEILIASRTEDVLEYLSLDDSILQRVSRAARERVLQDHTAERRVDDLESILALTDTGPISSRADSSAEILTKG